MKDMILGRSVPAEHTAFAVDTAQRTSARIPQALLTGLIGLVALVPRMLELQAPPFYVFGGASIAIYVVGLTCALRCRLWLRRHAEPPDENAP